jgi:lysophospholipase L1-like esterase
MSTSGRLLALLIIQTQPLMKLHILPFLTAAALSLPSLATAEIAVKSGDKIAFLGDSITAGGWGNPAGYVKLVIAGLEANGIKAEPIPAGISGHKSDQMLARLDKDVLSKKPQWMTLSCGVNDVWHGPRGVPLDDAMAKSGTYDDRVASRGTYQKNITAIIDQATAAGVKPVMLTATVIQENLASKENGLLAPYNNFLRQLAKEKNVPMADLFAMFEERLKAENKPKEKVLTSDGVHMNGEGNKLMAIGVLQAFGLNATELDKAKASWPALEEAAVEQAKKQAEARAKAAAEKAKGTPQPKKK